MIITRSVGAKKFTIKEFIRINSSKRKEKSPMSSSLCRVQCRFYIYPSFDLTFRF